MSEDITMIERSEQQALCISETVGTMKLGKVMGPAYQAIMDHFKEHDIKCGEKDIPFTKYKNIDWEKLNRKGLFAMINMMFFHKWEIDIGIPCPESATGEGLIKKMQLESGKYVRTIHKGPYMKVGDTYKKIRTYAIEHNLKFENYSIEFYLNDPREIPASQLETEVLVPVL
ncbi:MAG: GyrI-like domain-containing protein [Desulfamplus sp.]|nr:GyrI-like domain-containing protein [Desulfamplus sp.]